MDAMEALLLFGLELLMIVAVLDLERGSFDLDVVDVTLFEGELTAGSGRIMEANVGEDLVLTGTQEGEIEMSCLQRDLPQRILREHKGHLKPSPEVNRMTVLHVGQRGARSVSLQGRVFEDPQLGQLGWQEMMIGEEELIVPPHARR